MGANALSTLNSKHQCSQEAAVEARKECENVRIDQVQQSRETVQRFISNCQKEYSGEHRLYEQAIAGGHMLVFIKSDNPSAPPSNETATTKSHVLPPKRKSMHFHINTYLIEIIANILNYYSYMSTVLLYSYLALLSLD